MKTLASDPALPFTVSQGAIIAAAVPPPTPTGHIIPMVIQDVTAGNKQYLYSAGGWPISLPLNDVVWGGVTCYNDTGAAINVKLSVWFADPSGNTRGLYTQTINMAAGGAAAMATPDVTLDKAGEWYLSAKMESA